MANRHQNYSDLESGEENESDSYAINDEDLRDLPQVERERILAERYTRLINERQRKELALGQDPQAHKNRRHSIISSSSSEHNKKPKKRNRDEDYNIWPKPKKRREVINPIYNIKKESSVSILDDIEKIRLSRDQLAK